LPANISFAAAALGLETCAVLAHFTQWGGHRWRAFVIKLQYGVDL
jgi:hypothetical protein